MNSASKLECVVRTEPLPPQSVAGTLIPSVSASVGTTSYLNTRMLVPDPRSYVAVLTESPMVTPMVTSPLTLNLWLKVAEILMACPTW